MADYSTDLAKKIIGLCKLHKLPLTALSKALNMKTDDLIEAINSKKLETRCKILASICTALEINFCHAKEVFRLAGVDPDKIDQNIYYICYEEVYVWIIIMTAIECKADVPAIVNNILLRYGCKTVNFSV